MKTAACRLKRRNEFFALAVVCDIIQNKTPDPNSDRERDAFAIHGRLGAQVALPQSPISPNALTMKQNKT